MMPYPQEILSAVVDDEIIVYPAQGIAPGEAFFYPFNMPLADGLLLKYADATPLCILHGWEKPVYVFYAGHKPVFELEGDENAADILTISKEKACYSHKICTAGKEYLVVCADELYTDVYGRHIAGIHGCGMQVFPAFSNAPHGFLQTYQSGRWAAYQPKAAPVDLSVQVQQDSAASETHTYTLHVSANTQNKIEVLLQIDAVYDTACLVIDGQQVSTSFYTGEVWQVHITHVKPPFTAQLVLQPLYTGAAIQLPQWPPFRNGIGCYVNTVCARQIFDVNFRL